MNELLFTLLLVGVFVGYAAWKGFFSPRSSSTSLTAKELLAATITSDRSQADYYYGSREGSPFPRKLREQIYLRVNGCCEFPGCGRATFFGRPDSKSFKDTFKNKFGIKTAGDCHHKIPQELGGKGIASNGIWLCQRHNVKLGARITIQTLLEIYQQGKKLYLDLKAKDLKGFFYKGDIKLLFGSH